MTTYKVICDCCGRNITDAAFKIRFEVPNYHNSMVTGCCCDYSIQRIVRTPKEYDLCGDCYDDVQLEFENVFLKKERGAVIITRK